MTKREYIDKIKECTESLKMVETQLRWILSECEKHKYEVGTPRGAEMYSRFMGLYRNDFKRVLSKIEKLGEMLYTVEFRSGQERLEWSTAQEKLWELSHSGIFQQFISVAEKGHLPPEC